MSRRHGSGQAVPSPGTTGSARRDRPIRAPSRAYRCRAYSCHSSSARNLRRASSARPAFDVPPDPRQRQQPVADVRRQPARTPPTHRQHLAVSADRYQNMRTGIVAARPVRRRPGRSRRRRRADAAGPAHRSDTRPSGSPPRSTGSTRSDDRSLLAGPARSRKAPETRSRRRGVDVASRHRSLRDHGRRTERPPLDQAFHTAYVASARISRTRSPAPRPPGEPRPVLLTATEALPADRGRRARPASPAAIVAPRRSGSLTAAGRGPLGRSRRRAGHRRDRYATAAAVADATFRTQCRRDIPRHRLHLTPTRWPVGRRLLRIKRPPLLLLPRACAARRSSRSAAAPGPG